MNLKYSTLKTQVVIFCLTIFSIIVAGNCYAENNAQTTQAPATPQTTAPASVAPQGTAASKQNDKSKTKTERGSQSKTLGFFNAVNLAGIGNLYIKQTLQPGFTVEADKDILPLVIVYVKDKVLYIDLKNATEHSSSKINYYLNVKDLKKIESTSSSVIYIQETFTTKELTLSVTSFGEANVDIAVDKFIAEIENGSKITAQNSAANQNISINGAGEYHGKKLRGKTITLDVTGSGIAEIGPSDKLDVTTSGDATIKYCGKPAITKDISGKGTITPADGC